MSIALLTSYFSKKIHPNDPNDSAVIGRAQDGRVLQNEISYIKPWYDSVSSLSLNGFVFYDNLSDEFVETYTTENIKFIKVQDFEYSNNDFRFFCFRDFLTDHKFDFVFHSDASDVQVIKDPSSLILDNPEISYFACKDSIKLNQFNYMQIHEKYNFDDRVNFLLNYNNWDLINMGVVGGRYEDMKNFYQRFCDVRIRMGDSHFNSDMWLCQYLFRSQFQNKSLMMGHPVCSEFKKFQNERKDVYFIHK